MSTQTPVSLEAALRDPEAASAGTTAAEASHHPGSPEVRHVLTIDRARRQFGDLIV